MNYMTEIDENKYTSISGHIQKALAHMEKVMQCMSEMNGSDEETASYSPYRRGTRHPYREYRDDDHEGYGRYSRY